MALTLTLLDINKDASIITLASTDAATPAAATITWRYWTDETGTDKVLTADEITDLFSAGGLAVTPAFLGSASSFSDGIHHLVLVADSVSVDLKILVNKAAERCIASAVGKLAEAKCECLETEKTLNKLIRWRFAADVKHTQTDYDGAHNLIIAVGKYCDLTNCNC